MLKRLSLLLFIFVVIISILGYKLASSRPDLIAGITGKDFLLKSPLNKIVDIEKLYIRPEESVEIKLLKTEIEQIRMASIQAAGRERNLSSLSSKLELLTGKREIKNIADAIYFFNASEHPYTSLGPENSELNRFFYWEGPFSFVADDYYFVCFNKPDLTQAPSEKAVLIDGFALKQARKWFTDSNLKPDTMIAVVGRYAGRTEIQLANNQKAHVPLLVDCYVAQKSN
jgi:hypothetical protein